MAKTNRRVFSKYDLIGWREWCQLPDLRLPLIKAKIDTGAKTSALHAFDITPFTKKGVDYVRFLIHPIQGNNTVTRTCTAKIKDKRVVTSSNGSRESRYVVDTQLQFQDLDDAWNIELTLSNREPLRYRMLLGREALRDFLIINPNKSFLQGKFSPCEVDDAYEVHG
jgi:ribosomal protein S6--L-glutamate ligase